MLFDTKELVSLFLLNNHSCKNEIKILNNLNKFVGENYIKDGDNKNIDYGQKFKKIKFSKDFDDDEDKNKKSIINKRINVINNNLEEETNRKKIEESELKVISHSKSEAFEEIKAQHIKTYIKLNFDRINEKEYFNCFDYLCYVIFCKQIKTKIKYYEDLRRIIISEEIMFQNYLNINKLLEFHQIN